MACPDDVQQHVAALGGLRETIRDVDGAGHVPDLLDRLLLGDALPQLNDIRMKSEII